MSACLGQPNLAVGQADFHVNLPDGQPNILHFVAIKHIGQVKFYFGQPVLVQKVVVVVVVIIMKRRIDVSGIIFLLIFY
jgi:hypothetical protein